MGCFPEICTRLRKKFKTKNKNRDSEHDDQGDSQKICCIKQAYLNLRKKFKRKSENVDIQEEIHPTSHDGISLDSSSVEPIDYDFMYQCENPRDAKIEVRHSDPEMTSQRQKIKTLRDTPNSSRSLPNLLEALTVPAEKTFRKSNSMHNIVASTPTSEANIIDEPENLTTRSTTHPSNLSSILIVTEYFNKTNTRTEPFTSSKSKSVSDILSQMLTNAAKIFRKTSSSSERPTIRSYTSLPALILLANAAERRSNTDFLTELSTLRRTQSLTGISSLLIYYAAELESRGNSNFENSATRSWSLPNLYCTNPALVLPINRNLGDNKHVLFIHR